MTARPYFKTITTTTTGGSVIFQIQEKQLEEVK